MKISIKSIIPQEKFINVTVTFFEEDVHLHRKCDVSVFVDKSITDIASIEEAAITNAKEFIALVTQGHS